MNIFFLFHIYLLSTEFRVYLGNTLKAKESKKIEQQIYSYYQGEWCLYLRDLSWYVSVCTVLWKYNIMVHLYVSDFIIWWNYSDLSWYVSDCIVWWNYSDLSWYVSDCTVRWNHSDIYIYIYIYIYILKSQMKSVCWYI